MLLELVAVVADVVCVRLADVVVEAERLPLVLDVLAAVCARLADVVEEAERLPLVLFAGVIARPLVVVVAPEREVVVVVVAVIAERLAVGDDAERDALDAVDAARDAFDVLCEAVAELAERLLDAASIRCPERLADAVRDAVAAWRAVWVV